MKGIRQRFRLFLPEHARLAFSIVCTACNNLQSRHFSNYLIVTSSKSVPRGSFFGHLYASFKGCHLHASIRRFFAHDNRIRTNVEQTQINRPRKLYYSNYYEREEICGEFHFAVSFHLWNRYLRQCTLLSFFMPSVTVPQATARREDLPQVFLVSKVAKTLYKQELTFQYFI